MKELAESGHLHSFIDRRFPLEETAQAHSYVESGDKVGHVVIVVNEREGESVEHK